jgi:tetratricopeptide (TPR) repeat protein
MLARFPHSPKLLALKCAAQATAFDFAAADASLAEFDKLFGKSPLAQYETGKALSDARQYAQSRTHLDEAARRQPNAAEPLIELGLMLLQAGKDVDALPALQRAFSLDPFNVRADNSLRLARELATYEKVETPHYTIRYKPGLNTDSSVGDAILARDMAAPLEANYAIVTGSAAGGIDYPMPIKTTIDLMPDHKWFGVRIAGMPAIHTIAASTGPVIAMESPRDGPSHLGAYDWVRVLRHEFVHTVTLARTDNRIPHWYTEAAAVYLELSPRDYSTCQLLAHAHHAGELFDFTEINLGFIRPKKPSDRSQAYAQGHWMYEYIIARAGPKAPLELMDKYAKGVREEEAFQSVLGISRAQFLAEFIEWAHQQLIEWGMDLPDGTPTIRQLLAKEALSQSPGGNARSETKDDTGDKDIARDKAQKHAERLDALQRIAKDKASDDDSEIELPSSTPEMIAKWLADWPRHADVLELAMDDAVAKAGNKATPAIAPLIERYAAARPVDPKPHRLLAKMYLDAAEADPANTTAQATQAIAHLEYLDAREQKTPIYAMELAKRYAATGDMDKAKAKSERATQIDPFNARPRELAATIAIQARDYPTAQRHIEALTQIEPTRDIHTKRLEALQKLKAQAK